MTKVSTGASMSLDGYIAGPAESGFEHLLKWWGNGEVEVRCRDHPGGLACRVAAARSSRTTIPVRVGRS
jgi:hypothetical protein